MTITQKDVIDLSNQFHGLVMDKKGSAEEQAEFFLYPEPMIILLQGGDVSLQKNYEIHQKLTDEVHIPQPDWIISSLCKNPERVRAVGCIYWEGRLKESKDGSAKIKCLAGEDWIIQRTNSGKLKFALYINTYHYFLPDSAKIDF